MGIHLNKLYAVFQALDGGDTGTASLLGVYFNRDDALAAPGKSAPAVPPHFKPAHHFLVTLDGTQMEAEEEVEAKPEPKPEVLAEADVVEPAAIEAKSEKHEHKKGLFHR